MLRTWQSRFVGSQRRRRGGRSKLNLQRNRNLSPEPLEPRLVLASDVPVISEFMASNDGALLDQFGLSSDWIEIFNPTPAPISLAGWHLTDDAAVKDKWTFPDVTLDSGQFKVVFASGDDVKDTGGPLHTNFRLSAAGEYLGLIKPDLTVAFDFGEAFPAQFSNVSYGLGAISSNPIADDTPLSYHVPSASEASLAMSAGWTQRDFDDSSWKKSANTSIAQGIGYALAASATDFEGQFAVDVNADIFLKTGSLWVRQEFDVANPADVDGLLLDIQYDDGFVAYINGVEVARMNTPEGDLNWNSEADVPRRPRRRNSDALVPERFDIGEHTNALVAGRNVLAIHALNDTSFDEELLSRATLTSFNLPSDPSEAVIGYLKVATPGSANRQLIGGSVQFSESSKMFTEAFPLEITTLDEGESIRFTTDGSDPTASSDAYSGPIQVTETITIRAAAFPAAGDPGPVSVRSFVRLDDNIGEISSALPLVVFSSPITAVTPAQVPDTRVTNSYMTVFEPGPDGRTTITTEPVVSTQAGIQRRGSSTSGNPKLNLAVETRDDSGSERAVRLLGMPADSDWVFYAPYNFDRTKGIRNSFFYEIANQTGHWAPRTRLVEVYHNVDGDPLNADDYQGIYVIIEKIQRGENRVNIQKLAPTDITEPNITGGWIWKIDRADPGDSGVGVPVSGGGGAGSGPATLLYVNPKEEEVENIPEQVEWVRAYFNNVAATLRDPNSTWDQITDTIDVGGWIDNSIVNVLTLNLDAYRLSGYLYKDRGGKLEQGPVWDCDRCMGSEDGRDRDPFVWHSRVSDYGTSFFEFPWWRDLYANQPNFWQAWIDRWFELRQEVLSDENMTSIVDTFAAQIEDGQQRDTDKWRQTPNGGQFAPPGDRTWGGEVIHLKGWLEARAGWIDERFVTPPTIIPGNGQLGAGQQVTLAAAKGTIYYTTDGSDPRASGGGVAPGALTYTGPITVDNSATIVARAFDDSEPVILNPNRTHDDPRSGSFWSAPTTVHYDPRNIANASNLRITEVNYNPPDATPEELRTLGQDAVDNGVNNDEFEFIELMNISDAPIQLGGAQFVRVHALDANQGVVFTFADQTLAPGERAVVVENVDAFRARFGNTVRILDGNDGGQDAVSGEYGGQLQNRGEALKVVDKFGTLIQRFSYDDQGAWPKRADGRGSSLEVIDVNGNFADPSNWRASSQFGGSPGTEGLEQADSIVVTEVLTNTDQAGGDRLELHNPTGSAIDITNWFISNSAEDISKFRVTTPTSIPAGGYAVFSEQQLGFGFDGSRGDHVSIVSGNSSGRPLAFIHEATFPNSARNVSLGRWPDFRGAFFPMATTTLGAANSGVRPGDVIISEVNYSPVDPDGAGRQKPDDLEFIELFNQTGSEVNLAGWRLSGQDVNVTFAEGTTIGSGETLVLVPFDPSAGGSEAIVFQFFYGITPSVKLYGDFRADTRRGSLDDEGGHLLLQKPGTPPEDDPGFTPLVWVDELTYDNDAPWPADVIGNGKSLTRVSARDVAFLPSNWVARTASPGTAEFTVRIPGDANEDGKFNQQDISQVLQSGKYLTGQPATFAEGDWNGDGVFDQKDIVAALQAGHYMPGVAALRPSRLSDRNDPVASRPLDTSVAQRSLRQRDTDAIFALLGRTRHGKSTDRLMPDDSTLSLVAGYRRVRGSALG